MIYVYSLTAALCAVGAEIYMKSNIGMSWFTMWPAWILALGINYSIWGVLQRDSILALAVFFTLFVSALRLAYTLHMGTPITSGTWVAFALVVTAGLVKGLSA